MRAARRLALSGVLALGACATSYTADDCAAVDWNRLGYAAGSAGAGPAAEDNRFAACAAAGAAGDRRAFHEGYDEGLERYCTFDGVLQAALRGQGDILYCPDPTYAMEEAFDAGHALHRAESERDEAQATLRDARSRFRADLAEADRLRGKLPYIDNAERRQEIRREIDRRRSEAYRQEQRGRDAAYRYARAADRAREAARRVERLVRHADELRALDAQTRQDRSGAGYPPLIGGNR